MYERMEVNKMYTNRIDTAGNTIYEEVNSFNIIFCPYCGAMNYINLPWYGSIQGKIFCDRCGGEIG